METSNKKLSLLRIFLQFRQYPLRCERDFAQFDSHRVENCAGDGRWYWNRGQFAGAERRNVLPVDQDDIELRNLSKFQDRITRPIQARYSGSVECNLFQ